MQTPWIMFKWYMQKFFFVSINLLLKIDTTARLMSPRYWYIRLMTRSHAKWRATIFNFRFGIYSQNYVRNVPTSFLVHFYMSWADLNSVGLQKRLLKNWEILVHRSKIREKAYASSGWVFKSKLQTSSLNCCAIFSPSFLSHGVVAHIIRHKCEKLGPFYTNSGRVQLAPTPWPEVFGDSQYFHEL